MRLRPLALACAVAAAAAGCGKSQIEKIRDEQQAFCLAFPANQTTLRGATERFGDFPGAPLECLPGADTGADPRWTRWSNDVCDHTGTVCQLGWCYYPQNDPDLCGPNGCAYWCQVRVVPKDADQDGRLDDDTVICASRFLTEQIYSPYCYIQ